MFMWQTFISTFFDFQLSPVSCQLKLHTNLSSYLSWHNNLYENPPSTFRPFHFAFHSINLTPNYFHYMNCCLYCIYLTCGLQLPKEPHWSTRLLQLTGRWQYNGIMWLASCSVKSNNIDFLNQIRYFSIK